MIKAIFFDYDGVIVESVDVKTKAFGELFEEYGQEVSEKVVSYHLANTGVSRYDKFRYIFREILRQELSEMKFQELCERFSDLVKDNVISSPYVKGAREFLETESSNYCCYVTSATPEKELEEIIRERKESAFFKCIYGAPTEKKAAIKKVLSKEKLIPTQALYIGDAMSDYAAAKSNSVKFVARVYRKDVIFKGVDCLKIKDLKALPLILKEAGRI